MGSMSVSSCRCYIFVSCVYPVVVLNVVVCMTRNVLMLVQDVRGDPTMWNEFTNTQHTRQTDQLTEQHITYKDYNSTLTTTRVQEAKQSMLPLVYCLRMSDQPLKRWHFETTIHGYEYLEGIGPTEYIHPH